MPSGDGQGQPQEALFSDAYVVCESVHACGLVRACLCVCVVRMFARMPPQFKVNTELRVAASLIISAFGFACCNKAALTW